jgi:hypothetical protein
MATTSRAQRRYDHRLRDLVQRTGDLTIATDLDAPRSTACGWLDAAPRVVVGLEAAALTKPELRQEILKLVSASPLTWYRLVAATQIGDWVEMPALSRT